MAHNSKHLSKKYWALILGCVLLLIIASSALVARGLLRSKSEGQPIPPVPQSESRGTVEMQETEIPLPISLSEGKAQPATVEEPPVTQGEPLLEEEIKQILARLPELVGGTQVEFNLPVQPIPPPRPGETISEAFPPASPAPIQPVTGEAGPLQVLRYGPEGEIPIAPFLSVTFNQPMVPLGTLADLALQDVPVQFEPALPGVWRWLGTKTLTFQYDSSLIDRLPKATEFRATIPAGTRSANGALLAEPVTWTFRTPPPVAITTYPYNTPQPLEPVFFIAFDQRINPAAVLETIRVRAGSQPVSLALASQEEIEADPQVKDLAKNTPEGRWLAFRAGEAFPTDTSISVEIGPGTPSAEGPLVTKSAQVYSFQTYAPLKIVQHGCAWSGSPCRPFEPLYIRFNNPLDSAAYQESWLRIEPKVPGVSVSIFGDTLQIQGAFQGRTSYRATVSAELRDAFGQELGKDQGLAFQIGPAERMLIGPEKNIVTVDPFATKPSFSVYATNYPSLDVKIYAVQPSDWPSFRSYVREYQRTNVPRSVPGTLVLDKSVPLDLPPDSLTEVPIDLSAVMDGSYGHFIVIVAPPKSLIKNEQERFWQTIHAWVQVTQIGLDAYTDQGQMVAWATTLKDGVPLSGVTIEPEGTTAPALTGEDGVAAFPILYSATYLVARQGIDQALLPRSSYIWDDTSWQSIPLTDWLSWYVFDDRQMYRPGEEVHFKGWLRRLGAGPSGDLGLTDGKIFSVHFRVIDPQGNDLGGGEAAVNALGGFDFAFSIPQQVNLGYAQLLLTAQGDLGGLAGADYQRAFQIQEFRRPEFEVTARNETPPPYFAGEYATVAVEAKYYAGGALPNAEVTWQVSSSPGQYSPPNWPDFTFGIWKPWWSYEYSFGLDYYGAASSAQVQTFTGKTDASGVHFLRLDFEQAGPPRPVSILAQATVMDVNRQAWSATTSLLVHPADLYVGLRSERYFVERGQPLKVDLIVTDLDGKPVADRPVEVRAARLEWKYRGGNWSEEEVDVQTCKLGSTLEPSTCTFTTEVGGSYRITASVTDPQGRQNQSQLTRWVSGGKQPVSRKVEQESLTLIPDKESYQPGDVARILIQPPFSPAEGLLTVSRSGILYTERFRIDAGTATLEIPIQESYLPNLNIQVDLVGSAPRLSDLGEPIPDVPPRPAYASGRLNLPIPPTQRSLSLQLELAETELEPGGETTLDVFLKDASGQPVPGAELAVVVVDEAILALTNYQLADPLAVFYPDRPAGTESVYARASLVLVDPLSLLQRGAGGGVQATAVVEKSMQRYDAMPAAAPAPMEEAAMGGMPETQPASIRVRADFNPLAVFAPAVPTDQNGAASLTIKLPDNLTRYRLMVVAVDPSGRKFGEAESNLTARLPLMVRPSPPRFLNFGDRFELPVVLQNQTGEPLTVDVAIQATNLKLTVSNGMRIIVPARDRVEVRFPAETDQAGIARFQIAAVSGGYTDAATGELPVYTPATTEAFATYGVLDQGAVAQPVLPPSDVFPQFGGLEISTSSTALQALTDAVLYLVSYPFECSEQLASRILAVAALRDVLSAFDAEGLPAPAEIEAAVLRDLEELRGLQNDDGGFPYWRRGFDSIPFNTIHVAHALQRAAQMGFEVPTEMQSRALEYLRQIESHYPAWYDLQTRRTLSSYALFVRDRMGDPDPNKSLRLLEEAGIDGLSMDALGWLWMSIQDTPNVTSQLEAIRRYVENHTVETAGAANFTTAYSDQTYLLLSSDRRTDAILLEALILDQPQHDLIPKVVNGLLAHRVKGRWNSTQENVFVLLALDRYFKTFEATTPDFIARLWLGETYAGEHEFRGRTTERHATEIPMAYLVAESQGGQTQNLILSKDGPGRLYYRLGLRYAPTDLNLPPVDMGFVVQRSYEGVDDPADVTRDADGVWHIKAGTRVRVRLSMVADNRRYHVALVDPLPAGLEIVNPAIEVSGSVPQDPSRSDYRYGWWWWGTWYEHQNLRDERAEAFTSLLWDGVYEYTYIARATTPGAFIAPPAKAEEMYSPEVFGRSASDWVIVK